MSESPVYSATIEELDTVKVVLAATKIKGPQEVRLKTGGIEILIRTIEQETNDEKQTLILRLFEPIDLSKSYHVSIAEHEEFPVQVGAVVRTIEFDELFFYPKDDLGLTWSKEKSVFKVWAPTATDVRVVVYLHWSDEKGKEIPMIRGDKGVWSLTLHGDYEGNYYTFQVCTNGHWNEAVDPYAKAVSINGEKGAIISNVELDLKQTEMNLSHLSPSEIIIYEAHIRDFTIHKHSGAEFKGKFKGMMERDTRGKKGSSTGLDYLQELGITHVELLPVNDFGSVDEEESESQYNWGYDPVHYFSVEGSYATTPYEPKVRIRELKELIRSLHEGNLRVIIDVVYNHVYIWELSNFEKIVPGYYFRYEENGDLANGTGVGNDIASERKMVRKFIVDCVVYWVTEYDIDGFRFDLMGNLDIETMKAVTERISNINKNCFILGEGWDLSTPLQRQDKAIIDNAQQLPEVGFFNDRFRDALKGSSFNVEEKGFVNGNKETEHLIKQGLLGFVDGDISLFNSPVQSINYIECHDNYTLWDKLMNSNPDEEEGIKQRMHRLGTAIILTSQGIPFLHAGQEFYRTKEGVENSYCSPDSINQIDWDRKELHLSYVNYVKGLIKLRKDHPGFRLPSAHLIQKHCSFFETPPHVIGYKIGDLQGIDDWENIIAIYNGSWSNVEISLPKGGVWNIVVDDETVSLIPLNKITEDKVWVKPLTTMIMYQ
ncbi:type I pullulanase [Bacillus alkalicellulosilyticus]|uniref:type I pullulanase n=1 Tax=Alkalihalobacterium alkalicellulosilyticum TaxID=1912214 RepID=UPI0009973CD3|nr:type I pullulanase [Bacillus alkalicellulosilyticus]